ncbi:MAG: beta galactosidase jelly roll domain-containing protein, partial [Armatimonadota bacterium]
MRRGQLLAVLAGLLAVFAATSPGGAAVTVTDDRTLDLNGAWQFAVDPEGRFDVETVERTADWRTIEVPSCWEAQFPDLLAYDGVAWYQRTFTVPAAWHTATVRLCFGAVDYFAEVWVNGHHAGTHEGGYTPYAFDVTPDLAYGSENAVAVRVTDPTNDRDRFAQFPFDEVPSGKQGHYCQTGGIWQRVWLEARPNPYVGVLHVTPDVDA